jgi:hypothetical protein
MEQIKQIYTILHIHTYTYLLLKTKKNKSKEFIITYKKHSTPSLKRNSSYSK